MFYPGLVVAILAAVVASQTMITATFQLLSQIIKLSYFPQVCLLNLNILKSTFAWYMVLQKSRIGTIF